VRPLADVNAGERHGHTAHSGAFEIASTSSHCANIPRLSTSVRAPDATRQQTATSSPELRHFSHPGSFEQFYSRPSPRIFSVRGALVMAALCNRGPLYFCPVVSFFLSIFFLFFPRLISAATDWMSTTHGVALVRI